ncbi:MAG TPA: iron-containing alcohol dehydrogenase [Cytophagaceae bacterium]|jgi:NADP-dependent alcohol dehydrogenase|nr:iron-containing alcohol dehydrogenase [Cytophagaceae bacterium]
MLNFEFKNPTKLFFGRGQISVLAKEIPTTTKILLLYGGGSIKTNGIYEQVMSTLNQHKVVEFRGIDANPEYDTLMKALNIIKTQDIDFLLAVGGGSVIDGTKFLSAAALYKGNDPWEILSQKVRTETGMPFATVLTLPATGSEMNSSAVITRAAIKEKLAMGGPGLFPLFSILDPQVVSSIPLRQLQNGIIDAYMHVLEQYLTYPIGALLQDRFAESILKTLTEVGPAIIKDSSNYNVACEYMWCCTMALNGLIQKGVPNDWATHMIGHELTALLGIDHARTLAIIVPHLYHYKFENKKNKLAQYAERIWNITQGSVEEKAQAGIQKTSDFFHQLGVSTKLSDYTQAYDNIASSIEERFTQRGWTTLGERKDINPSDVKKIIEMSY